MNDLAVAAALLTVYYRNKEQQSIPGTADPKDSIMTDYKEFLVKLREAHRSLDQS